MYEYLDRRYADALYKVAENKGKVEAYLSDLREIVHIIYNSENVLRILEHPDINSARKKKVFTELFASKIDDELLAFLLILIDKDRILFIREKLKEMEKIHLEKKNILKANIKTAVPLTDSQRSALTNKLQLRYGSKILLEEEIDEGVIGGVMVMVGSDAIDGTVKTRLYEIKERAINSKWR